MAVSVSVCGVPSRLEGPCWRVDALWWDGRKLLGDPRFRRFLWDESVAVMESHEVLALNEEFLRGVRGREQREDGAKLAERIAAEAQAGLHLLVVVWEWDSGYG